jgi:hypothetical protein
MTWGMHRPVRRGAALVGALLALGPAVLACAAEEAPAAPDEPDILARLTAEDGATPPVDASGSVAWDAWIFDKKGKPKAASYLAACAGMELKQVDRRLGPGYDVFHPPAKASGAKPPAAGAKAPAAGAKAPAATAKGADPGTVDGFALGEIRFPDGTWWWQKPSKPASKDWTGHGGELAYVPDQAGASGVDNVQFCWSHHENHGGGKYYHAYLLRPLASPKDGSEYWTQKPDQALLTPGFQAAMAKDPCKAPVAIARSSCCWNTHGLMAFRNGFITDSGCGNAGPDGRVQCQLPPGKVPTAIAITPNNELALVAVWDCLALKGQVAVLALDVEGEEKPGQRFWMLPGDGWLAHAKLLGFVDLPFATPSGISASADWCSTGGFASELHYNPWTADAARRAEWEKAPPGTVRMGGPGYPRAGYAAVISRAENKLAFIDLAPLLGYVRSIYFTTDANAAKIRDEGPADRQWPHAFSVLPAAARPTVTKAITIGQPTAVSCGFPDGDAAFATTCVVATMDGKVVTFDVGALNTQAVPPRPVTAVGMVRVGRNPTSINHGSRSLAPRASVLVTCRGDREIAWVSISGGRPAVTRTLRDARIVDPVAAEPADTRGARLVTVADFAGRQIINYLYEPIDSWGEKLFGGLGKDGTSAFECTGSLAFPGHPYLIGGSEIP